MMSRNERRQHERTCRTRNSEMGCLPLRARSTVFDSEQSTRKQQPAPTANDLLRDRGFRANRRQTRMYTKRRSLSPWFFALTVSCAASPEEPGRNEAVQQARQPLTAIVPVPTQGDAPSVQTSETSIAWDPRWAARHRRRRLQHQQPLHVQSSCRLGVLDRPRCKLA